MTRKIVLLSALAIASTAATPAHATWLTSKHKHYCHCGHSQGGSMCGTTSGGSTSTGGTTTSTGGTTTTSGGTTTGGTTGGQVPEPGMLAMMGLGLVGLGIARRRKRR